MEFQEEEVRRERTDVQSVICPWCKTAFDIRPGSNCPNCGGPLPPAPGTDRGTPPPPAPREFPSGYKLKMFFKNWHGAFGSVMIVFVLATSHGDFTGMLPFVAIGLFIISAGVYKAIKRLSVLEHGEVAEGVVTNAGLNMDVSENGRHPYAIQYVYDVGGNRYSGLMNCWDEVSTAFIPGDQIWVVYNEKGDSSIWPPIA